jgi:hypothetical protein
MPIRQWHKQTSALLRLFRRGTDGDRRGAVKLTSGGLKRSASAGEQS